MAHSAREMLTPLSRGFLLVGMFVLAQPLASTGAYNSDHRTVSRLGAGINTRSLSYDKILAAPGHMARNIENLRSGLYSDTLEDLTLLLEGAGSVHNNPLWSTGRASIFDDLEDDESVVTSLMTSLEEVSEREDSSAQCVNDTGRLLIGMAERQGWALKFLDSVGKPGPGLSEFRLNFVGDYHLCRSQVVPPGNGSKGFRGNYCTLTVALGPINPMNPAGTLMVQWGLCMPDSCTDEQNTRFVYEALQTVGLNGTLTVVPVQSHTDKKQATTATYVSLTIICIVLILMFLGTAYDVMFLQWPQWRIEWAQDEERNVNKRPGNGGLESIRDSSAGQTQADDEPLLMKDEVVIPPAAPQGKLAQALLAFSVYTNGSKVLNASQAPGSITCIHGIRFLSMTWVILGHTFASCITYVDNMATAVPVFLGRWTFDAVSNAFVSVDTFFTLSGILVSYLTVTEMRKRGWKLNWGLFYFHRFWRLTPPYMLVLLMVLGLQQYFGEGPLWSSTQPSDKENCEKYWWTNLLYINNLAYKEHVCFGHTWYLANDMQFFLVSPLMIIPFYFHPVLGSVSCLVFLLTHMITTGVLSTQHGWPTTLVSAAASDKFVTYFFDYYVAPWCRIGPYVVGIWTGYLLAKKQNKLKLTWPIALVGWAVATAAGLAALYGLRGDINGKHISSVGVAALYNAVARSAWGAAVCWVIVACVSGWGGFVNTLLSWSPFVVLGRLTYMAYLIHMNLLAIYFQNMQTLFHLTSLNIAMVFMGFLVATYSLAFVFMLAVESPMIGLEKVFLPKRRKD